MNEKARCESDRHIRKLWIDQLYREHELICWRYAVDLTKPLIDLNGSESTWGCWQPETRTIILSKRLIQSFPWDVTVNVLKHEMAHQIVSELFYGSGRHDALFHEACGLIGTPAEFCRAKGELLNTMSAEGGSLALSARPQVKVLQKIEKLLSLAQSANEHEAGLAMQKANEFIARYNIDRLEKGLESQYAYRIICHKKKRIENYQKKICVILMNYFYVEIVCSTTYDPNNCSIYKTIELLGTDENVKVAEYVYYFLLNQLDILWRQYKKINKLPEKLKRSYWLGVLEGFMAKLKQNSRTTATGRESAVTGKALVVQEDKRLGEFVRQRYPRLARSRSAAAMVEKNSYADGMADGRNIILHKGIDENDGWQGRLLQ